ncbi:hypothetical protein GGR53DRAFT_226733 [Hypoxylon sp. FL1150]|nr:hypothetical protein GGR53DRAFT_226733 [Hypoxylon sp. FL1150]
MLPNLARRQTQPGKIKEDIFALGSTIYFISTGYAPYHELIYEDEVEKLYEDGVFPGLDGVSLAEAIALCWRPGAEPAESIIDIIDSWQAW